jgi:F-box interacting protein
MVSDYRQDKYDLYSLSGERFQNKVKLVCSNPFRNRFCTRSFGFGSVNGILCLYDDSYSGETILWNPATQTIRLLPYSEVIESIESDEELDNDFASLTAETHLHGFGYDDLTDDYKVIRYVTFEGEHAGYGDISIEELDYEALYPFWEMYSLKSNSWKKLDNDMPPTSLYTEGTQVYMDGVCHWLSEEDCAAGPCLVSFYLSNEEFITTPIPGDEEDDDDFVFKASWINLVVVNGFIALISYHEDMTFHISIVGELGIEESWTKLLIVGPMPCVKYPIGAGTKGEIFFIREDEELVWFDLRKTFPQMTVELGYKGLGDTSQIIVYKENILPLGGISN